MNRVMTRWAQWMLCLLVVWGLAACGGGGGSGSTSFEQVAPADAAIGFGNATAPTVLNAVPAVSSDGSTVSTTLTIHYRRTAGDYDGWTLHTWDAAQETQWTNGRTPSATTSFGKVFQVPLDARRSLDVTP